MRNLSNVCCHCRGIEATAAAAEEPAAACNDMKTAMICSSKGLSLAMAAVSGTLIHLPLDGPVMIEVDLSSEFVYE